MILTPHPRELQLVLFKHVHKNETELQEAIAHASAEELQEWAKELGNSVIILKGKVDKVFSAQEFFEVEGGSSGMTKGGTGDVLAGLVAALACTNDLMTAAVVGSLTNKTAGEKLEETQGPFFNASTLITAIPETLWDLYQTAR
jgi:NAD(P)H-hydrate repair Nnr-like enzyme with NAD(P)H-hydrate dehydratase domain